MTDGWQPLREFEPEPDPDPSRGVFETVLVARGRAWHWDRHRERLAASCHDLYGAASLDDGLDMRVARLAAGRATARLRVIARPDGTGAVATAATITPLAGAAAGEPVLAPVRVRRGYGRHKLADRDWLERIEAVAPPGARALLVCGRDLVLETTRANVFALAGGVLATAPLDGSILPGVMRAVLIEQARALGLEVREAPLPLAELLEADAVLLTGSLRLVEARLARRAGGAAEVVAALRDAVGAA
jgi:branched-subunit amino acid aminotransferase/4-amino-4-deoxychorismate lyase